MLNNKLVRSIYSYKKLDFWLKKNSQSTKDGISKLTIEIFDRWHFQQFTIVILKNLPLEKAKNKMFSLPPKQWSTLKWLQTTSFCCKGLTSTNPCMNENRNFYMHITSLHGTVISNCVLPLFWIGYAYTEKSFFARSIPFNSIVEWFNFWNALSVTKLLIIPCSISGHSHRKLIM